MTHVAKALINARFVIARISSASTLEDAERNLARALGYVDALGENGLVEPVHVLTLHRELTEARRDWGKAL